MAPPLKSKVEAVLFASGTNLTLEKISKLVREKDLEHIRRALLEIASELDAKESSTMLLEENDSYRLTVREKYIPYIKRVARQVDLPKSLTETLAVIAYKSPVIQSYVIKVRHNKGYKHLDELEKAGFISRQKKGRSKLIKLTQKFFDYFDLSPEQLKQKFKNRVELEQQMEDRPDTRKSRWR